jgi:hypothetical protein
MAEYEGILAETVVFAGHDDDEVSGYLTRPLSAGPFPGVIVIHEVFGLVPHIKEIALKFASRGYVAIALDLHYREGPGDVDDIAAAVRAAGGVPDGTGASVTSKEPYDSSGCCPTAREVGRRLLWPATSKASRPPWTATEAAWSRDPVTSVRDSRRPQ